MAFNSYRRCILVSKKKAEEYCIYVIFIISIFLCSFRWFCYHLLTFPIKIDFENMLVTSFPAIFSWPLFLLGHSIFSFSDILHPPAIDPSFPFLVPSTASFYHLHDHSFSKLFDLLKKRKMHSSITTVFRMERKDRLEYVSQRFRLQLTLINESKKNEWRLSNKGNSLCILDGYNRNVKLNKKKLWVNKMQDLI